MNAMQRYWDHIKTLLDEVLDTQQGAMEQSAQAIAKAIMNKNAIYVFGCSHGGIFTEELFFRAGGLATFNPIFNPALMLNVKPVTLTSQFERIPGQSKAILDAYPIKEGDVILIHTVSGRNPGVVEMALHAKSKNMIVIGVTNVAYSSATTSRDPSGKRLFEVVDICIDNCGEFGDGCISLPGVNEKAGATSTVIGATIGNSISVRAAEIIIEHGMKPPIFHSANADGGDEINKKIFEQYKDVIHYM